MSTYAQKRAARPLPFTLQTRNELPPPGRQTAIEVLDRLLVEVLDIMLCARHANWNIRGVDPSTSGATFDEIASTMGALADRIAARIRALGGTAHGTVQSIAAGTSFKPYPVAIREGQAHIEAMALRLGLLSAEARLSILDCKELGDFTTTEVLTAANTTIDRALWLVERQMSVSA
jgi:starvation-inducible DNA-binding protein